MCGNGGEIYEASSTGALADDDDGGNEMRMTIIHLTSLEVKSGN
jgi:hypothetical protein